MPALVAGIHVFDTACKEDVDGRVEPGHDETETTSAHVSPGLNGSSLSGGTDCSAIARIIATIT